MPTHVTSRRVALAAAGGLFAALSLSGAAQAITDNVFRYTNPKTGHLAIHVMALTPDRPSSANSYFLGFAGALFGDGCYSAGINLPHGATMTRLSVWYTSNADSDPNVQIRRHPLLDGGTNNIVSQIIPDDSGTRKQRNFAIADGPLAKVNNARNAYGFAVCLDSGTTFHGARITYTYNQAGD